MTEEYLKLPEIARLLERPETTVRRWAKQFSEYLPKKPSGKRYVYPKSSLSLFFYIARLFESGSTLEEAIEKVRANHKRVMADLSFASEVFVAEQVHLPIDEENDDDLENILNDLADTFDQMAKYWEQLSVNIAGTDESMSYGYKAKSESYRECASFLRKTIEKRKMKKPRVVRLVDRRTNVRRSRERLVAR